MAKAKKKAAWQPLIGLSIGVLTGIVCGFIMASHLDASLGTDATLGETLAELLVMLAALYAAILLQIIIHEGGHLVFGLLSGYRFSSFRVMSFMWVKEGGQLKFKHLSIAGTGGQCLMTPPDLVDGNIPVTLYNLGGSLMNVFSACIFLILHLTSPHIPLLSSWCLMLAVIGFIFALLNGIPIKTATIDNDGHNAFALRHNQEAQRALWVQLKVNSEVARGIRLKDMPEEWFAIPNDVAMQNSLVAAVGVFACNRLMDRHQFDEADRLMAHLLQLDSGIAGLHRSLLLCDRLYVALVTQNRPETAAELLTREQKRFMKSMKNFPSILRTQYVCALLGEGDKEKAGKIKEKFEKCAKTYPYPTDIQSERELMEFAEKKPA